MSKETQEPVLSNADKMLAEVGFTQMPFKVFAGSIAFYTNHDSGYIEFNSNEYGKLGVRAYYANDLYGQHRAYTLSPKELAAINEKVKELGW